MQARAANLAPRGPGFKVLEGRLTNVCRRLAPSMVAAKPSGRGRVVVIMAGSKGLSVMVVESPTKAQKIQHFLGDNFKVLASYGHIRDLPSKAGSVKPDQDFEMVWEFTPGAGPRYAAIEDAVRGADKVVLATDPDREGEAISWHVTQELQKHGALRGRKVERVTFTEITKQAVTKALESPRQVAQPLVDAYMARRALDYLVGYNISPLLWRKLPGAKSAGRVQSVALRLCCDRETEIEGFKAQEYWSIAVDFKLASGEVFSTLLTQADGRKLGKFGIKDKAAAEQLAARIKSAKFMVRDVQQRSTQRQPAPPFITSTLQQEASRRLGFGAARTMKLAQQLYEGAGTGEGLITYMRTDGVQLSPEAITALRATATSTYGPKFVPPQPRVYKSRAKNAQEAHEAIRPTNPGLTPDSPKLAVLDPDARALYKLIWERSLASQMANATISQVGVDVATADGGLVLRATGSSVAFPGYLQAYDNFRKTEEEKEEEASAGGAQGEDGADADGVTNSGDAAAALLKLQPRQPVVAAKVAPAQHFTRPPPRYTEASLVKAMEEAGIGRPSTYAATLSVLQERGYVTKEGRALVPSSLGRVLSAFLVHYFGRYVDHDFTAKLEAQLDEISGGSSSWRGVLADFWAPFQANCEDLKDVGIADVYDLLDEVLGAHFFGHSEGAQEQARVCPMCKTGRLVLKPSKFGGFIGCTNFDAPDIKCSFSRAMQVTTGAEGAEGAAGGAAAGGDAAALSSSSISRELGKHPATGLPVLLKFGPFGPYVQVDPPASAVAAAEEAAAAKAKGSKKKAAGPQPKRVSIPKSMDPARLTLEDVLPLLASNRELGAHPEDGKPVVVQPGKFGPYVEHGDIKAPLAKDQDLDAITMEEALELLAAKKAKVEDQLARGIVPKGMKLSKAKAAATKKGSSASPSPEREGTPGGSSAAASKGPTAYLVFCAEQRPAAKAANPSAGATDVVKILAAQWKALPEGEKEVYKRKAAEQAAENAARTPSPSPTRERTPGGSAAAPKAAAAPSAYIIFCTEQRPAIKAANPGAGLGDISKILGAQWKALGDDEKEAYKAKAAESAGRTPSPSPARERTPGGSSAAAPKAAAAPSAYIIFCTEQRPAVKAANPGAGLGDISKILGAQWKALSEGEKEAYKRKASEKAAEMGAAGASTTATPKPARARSASVGASGEGGSDGEGAGAKKAASPAPRAPSAYMAFCSAMRPILKANNPDAGPSDIMKLLGVEWQKLSEVQKQEFAQKGAGASASASPASPAAAKPAATNPKPSTSSSNASSNGVVPGSQAKPASRPATPRPSASAPAAPAASAPASPPTAAAGPAAGRKVAGPGSSIGGTASSQKTPALSRSIPPTPQPINGPGSAGSGTTKLSAASRPGSTPAKSSTAGSSTGSTSTSSSEFERSRSPSPSPGRDMIPTPTTPAAAQPKMSASAAPRPSTPSPVRRPSTPALSRGAPAAPSPAAAAAARKVAPAAASSAAAPQASASKASPAARASSAAPAAGRAGTPSQARAPSPAAARAPSPSQSRSPSPPQQRTPSPSQARAPSPPQQRAPSPAPVRAPTPGAARTGSPTPGRRHATAFENFSEEERPRFARKFPKAPPQVLHNYVTAAWNRLNEEQKAFYEPDYDPSKRRSASRGF